MQDNIIDIIINAFVTFQPPIWIKLISFVISIVSAVIIYFLIKSIRNNSGLPSSSVPNKAAPLPSVPEVGVVARWSEIKRHVQSANEAEWKLAIIEADKLVHDILGEIGVPGDSLGEKLKNINSAQLTTINELWEAHKVRNKIAHDSGYFLRDVEARRVVDLFERSLKELEAI